MMINYSKTIVFYNIFLVQMIPYATVAATATRLGITAQQLTDLAAFQTAWNTAYLAYLSPLTYGRLTTAQINVLYRNTKLYCDGLKQQLKNNPALTLLEADYIYFDIHKDAIPRGSIPAPNQQAVVSLKDTHHLNNEYRVSDMANPTKAGKPTDVKKVKVFLLVQPVSAPPPPIDRLSLEMTVGSMVFDIPFTEPQINEIAYVAVCFSNDSGDGPMSAIIANTII